MCTIFKDIFKKAKYLSRHSFKLFWLDLKLEQIKRLLFSNSNKKEFPNVIRELKEMFNRVPHQT